MNKKTNWNLSFVASIVLCIFCFPAVRSLFAQSSTYGIHEVPPQVLSARQKRFHTNNADQVTELHKMFDEAGCKDIQEQTVAPKVPPNVICKLAGQGDSTIVVGADLNHLQPGVGTVDNWNGASLLPSIYQALKDTPRVHSILFVGFTNEEKGLAGSKYFLKQIPQAQSSLIKAMVNVECPGFSTSKAGLHSKDMMELFDLLNSLASDMHVPLQEQTADCVGDEDSTRPFRDQKIPTITIHSLTKDTSLVHNQYDSKPVLQIDKLYESYRLVTEYVSLIDQALN